MHLKILLICFLSVQTNLFSQFGFLYNDEISVFNNQNELKHPWSGGLSHPQFSTFDYNFDGEKDLFIFDRAANQIRVFIKVYDQNNQPYYEYVHEAQNNFPNDIRYRATLVDYDNDGKEDLFTYGIGGVKVYKNTGDINTGISWELAYEILRSQYLSGTSNLFVSSIDLPAFVDVDGDGDIDVLTFNIGGERMEYHRNTSMELYGIPDSLSFVLEDECWGKFRENELDNGITLNDNTGPCQNNLVSPAPGNEQLRHAGTTILATDLNGDGVLDIVLGDVDAANLTALYNGATSNLDPALMTSLDQNFPSNTSPVDLEIMPAPFYLDVDHDGIKDLIVSTNANGSSENKSSIHYYKNNGTNENPVFQYVENNFLQKEMINTGRGSIPILVDLNNDGLLDLLVSSNYQYKTYLSRTCKIEYYQNTGTAQHPEFTLISNDWLGLSSAISDNRLVPTFGDLNGDGTIEILLGSQNGSLRHYTRSGPNYNNFILQSNQLLDHQNQPIQAHSFSSPVLYDLNNDGLLDLIIGQRIGGLIYYENIGTTNEAKFKHITNKLGNIDLTSINSSETYGMPQFMRKNDTTYMVVGNKAGELHLYTDIDNNLNDNDEFLLLTKTLSNVSTGEMCAPAIAQLSDDGSFNMFLGGELGGLWAYKAEANSEPILSITEAWSEISQLAEKPLIFPNPSKNGQFYIKNMGVNMNLEIYNALGKKVLFSTQQVDGKYKVSLENEKSGIYFIKIYDDSNSKTLKLVVQ